VPSPGLWDDIAAIAGVPLVMWALALGQGLLIERAAKVRLPNALLPVLGFCSSMIVALGVYHLHAGNWLAIPVVAGLALAGAIVQRRGLRARLNAGWPLIAALVIYIGFNAAVILSGHWVISGYNIENDSAYELLLVHHLQAHGTAAASAVPSTANSVIAAYLATGYPLGSQSLLGVISGILGVSPAVAWQSFISAMAAVGALAASQLSGRTMSPRLGAAAGALALGAALTYEYALQGAIKEIAVLVAVLCSLAVIRYAILSVRSRTTALALCAIPLAAVLAAYNAAGLPYMLALAGSGAVAAMIIHRRLPGREWLRPGLIGLGVLVLASIPALLTIKTFYHTASSGFTGGSAATAPSLGPLFRKLPLSEISGVWMHGDYRLPIPPGTGATLTVFASAVILALLFPAVLRLVRAQEPGPLIGLVTVGLVLLIVYPRITPYAQAKLLAIASPIVVLCAIQALTGLRGWDWNALAAAAGLALVAAIAVSDALAYHEFPVSSPARMIALERISRGMEGRGMVLDSEFEQFAKFFGLPAELNVGPDSPTSRPLELVNRSEPQYGHSFDLSQERLGYIESFPYILVRRSPVTSPPPAGYTLARQNAYYELWRREGAPRGVAQVPFRGVLGAGSPVSCRALGALAARAKAGQRLLLAEQPPQVGFAMSEAAEHSPSWSPSSDPKALVTPSPGRAERQVDVPASGRYELWLEGNFPRRMSVTLDGHVVGSALGTDAPGGWAMAGTADVAAGRHVLGALLGGGNLSPGNGSTQASIGAVVLVPAGAHPRVLAVAPGQWRSLCGRRAFWAELAAS
jgi:hypothetical protein